MSDKIEKCENLTDMFSNVRNDAGSLHDVAHVDKVKPGEKTSVDQFFAFSSPFNLPFERKPANNHRNLEIVAALSAKAALEFWKCPICRKDYPNGLFRMAHKCKVVKWYDNTCPLEFPSMFFAMLHCSIKHKVCYICSKVKFTMAGLKNHLDETHDQVSSIRWILKNLDKN